jgi:hypothetical protein
MKFSFTYDIGFMGPSALKYALQGDTGDLPDPHGKTLESLLQYDPGETVKSNPAAKDLTEYIINLESDHKKKTITFKEDNIPGRLRPLINYLRSKASITTKK